MHRRQIGAPRLHIGKFQFPFPTTRESWFLVTLTRANDVLECCAKGNKLLGFVTRSSTIITVVQIVFGHASQVWCPQSIDLFKRAYRVSREEHRSLFSVFVYQERLVALDLMPVLARVYGPRFLFQAAVNDMVNISEDVFPKRIINLIIQ